MTEDPNVPRPASSLPFKYDGYQPWVFNPSVPDEPAPASSVGTAPGSAGNSVATRTWKRKASIEAAKYALAESSKKKGKLKAVIDVEESDEDLKAVEVEPEDMEDI